MGRSGAKTIKQINSFLNGLIGNRLDKGGYQRHKVRSESPKKRKKRDGVDLLRFFIHYAMVTACLEKPA
jgi:hypothetical protein